MVLGDIGQLVPVSDKDVEIKRNTFPTEKNSPLGKNPELKEVGKAGVYLVSDLASGVTGENHFVDCGYNIIAIPKE